MVLRSFRMSASGSRGRAAGQSGHSPVGRPRLGRLRVITVAYAFSVFLALSADADPDQLLAAADRFADLGNNVAARDLYAQAEKAFAEQNNRTKMLYARFGRLRRDVETGSYDAYLKEVEESLAEEPVEKTPALKIRGLALKAQINMNLNSAAARRDWEAVELLANSIGDAKWANRARGQLGIIAGIEGDYATALARLVSAITKAEAIDDTSAVIYFKTFLANGMTANNRAAQAIGLYDSAIALGTRSPESGYPLLPIIGKARALRALQKHTEALAIIDDALSRARTDNVLGAQTELLVLRGLSARDTSNWSLAEVSFKDAVEIARASTLR